MCDCEEMLTRLTAAAVAKYNDKVPDAVLKLALSAQSCDYPKVAAEKNTITMAVPSFLGVDCYATKLNDYFQSNSLKVESDCFVQLTEQSVAHEFDKKPVYIGSFTFAEDCEIEKITADMVMLFWSCSNDLFAEYLVKPGIVTLSEANLLRATAEFLHTQFAFIDRSRYNKYDICRYMVLNSGILRDLLDYFTTKFYPQTDGSLAFPASIYEDIDSVNSGVFYNDVTAKNILNAVADFLQNVRKSNYYSENKAALSFRLDPKFMDFYGNLDEAYNKSFPADRPYGVFFFYRKDAIGFQVRFAEIARGGWRTVVPKRGGNKLDEMALFDAANDEIFREGFVLAHTQHLKNKDIYEGGSKMIMLLDVAPSADFKPALWTAQRAVCEAFVSLINYDEKSELKDKNIVDTLGKKEIIEIGPDENMFDDMIVWMGKYANKAGYTLGSGLISGKPDSGILFLSVKTFLRIPR